MIQAMPDCDMDKFAKMRDVMATQEFKELLCSKDLPIEKKLNSLLSKALGETTIPQDLRDSYQITYQFANSPTFTCSCNKEKMKTAIKTLPEEELEEIYESNSKPKIVCQFCKKEYTFTKEELED
jgi:redox-regulated HSP33 family molecular chaperone